MVINTPLISLVLSNTKVEGTLFDTLLSLNPTLTEVILRGSDTIVDLFYSLRRFAQLKEVTVPATSLHKIDQISYKDSFLNLTHLTLNTEFLSSNIKYLAQLPKLIQLSLFFSNSPKKISTDLQNLCNTSSPSLNYLLVTLKMTINQ